MKHKSTFDSRDKESTLGFLSEVIEMSSASRTEVLLEAGKESLTRFAGNRIHQNVCESDAKLSIRTIQGGCIGYATTNRFDKNSLRKALDWALDIAKSGRIKAEPDGFAAFADFGKSGKYRKIENHYSSTAEFSPGERAGIVAALTEECSESGAEAAGAISNSEDVLAIANSEGLRAYHARTDSNFTATVSAAGATGWCDSSATDVSNLDTPAMGALALERALAGKNPTKLKPGRYTVILEEAAVKDFLDFLNWLGFGAQAFEEGRSYMCGKLGDKITGGNITVGDDAFHPLGAGAPFDYEGVPKEPVTFIENGIARGVAYDRAYAARAGRNSTGHALPARAAVGPFPLNIVMQPGDADATEMINSVQRGLLVSRFWYCRVVDPSKTLMTGQTRDGTFLIEDGEIVRGVRDMRFNENILESFARAEMISKTARRIGTSIVPSMKIADFNFTETVGES
jgi:predicted Zn-dependent protease